MALAHVVERPAECGFAGRDGRGGDRQALLGKVGDEIAKALALFAEQVLDRHARIGEGQLGGVLGVLTELLQVASALEPLAAALDHEQADAAVSLDGSVFTARITRSALMPLVMKVLAPSTT